MGVNVVTGKVRFSYVTLEQPRQISGQGEPKYSLTLLIPKSDTTTLGKVKAAIKQARDAYCAKNGANALPAAPMSTLYDGDGTKRNGDSFGPEAKGCYVLTCSNKENRKPAVFDAFGHECDAHEIYSGCYGRAHIEFYGYNTAGNKGVSCSIISVKKLTDGERLDGGTTASADAFDDGYDELDDLLG